MPNKHSTDNSGEANGQENSRSEPLVSMEKTEAWFAERGWEISDFQREVWQAYVDGKSGLIHSPTGSGKTLAAWFAPLLTLSKPPVGKPTGKSLAKPPAKTSTKAPTIKVLWITPLRALAVDTFENLSKPVADLELNFTIGLRTGDTTASERTKQRRRLPSALVTTPESTSLLLSYAETARQFSGLECVVVDEWHELIGSKRGVLLQLALARLKGLAPGLKVWGLSATIGNTQEAADVLHGSVAREGDSLPCIVRGDAVKMNEIQAIIPNEIGRFPWSGHMGLKLLPEVIERIDQASTTLLFANTRSQAERWYEALLAARLDWIDKLALHHGSLDRKLRLKVESMLREGTLKIVVATSTLDLGVDFSPVEQVIQVGSPKGIARLLQRAGRSGHRPGATSQVLCAPAHALELVEIAAARQAVSKGQIEARRPLCLSLDVLAQHVVTMALAGGVEPEQLLMEARSTHAFETLADDAWQWVLDFVIRGGPALQVYPQYQRVVLDEGLLKVPSRRTAAQHRMAIGTITADASMKVQFQRGGYLGMVEESFISRLKPGDVFLFTGKPLELVRVRDMAAQVKLATGSKKSIVPRWTGGRMALSGELADSILQLFGEADDNVFSGVEMQAVKPLLQLQKLTSALPRMGRLLIERTRSRDGVSIFIYPFAGRLVHEGLAALLAYRISQQQKITFTFSANDYGLELLSRDEIPFTADYFRSLLAPDNLLRDIRASINASEMARRQFRDIARIAGLVTQGYPGSQKTTRQVQASSGLLYDVLVEYDPNNRLPQQAEDEVLSAQFELSRLQQTLQRMLDWNIQLTEPERLTPLAFPLWAELQGSRLSSESWQERVRKMQQRLEVANDG